MLYSHKIFDTKIQQTFQVWLSTGSIWQNNNYPNEAGSCCPGRGDQSDYCQVMSPASSPYEISNQKFPPSDEAWGISRQIIKVLLESPGSCCEGRRLVTRQGRVKCSLSDQQDEIFSRLLPSDKACSEEECSKKACARDVLGMLKHLNLICQVQTIKMLIITDTKGDFLFSCRSQKMISLVASAFSPDIHDLCVKLRQFVAVHSFQNKRR